MTSVVSDERKKSAEALIQKLGLSKPKDASFSQSHPMVESYQILEKIMEFLSDCDNEAFTQLDKGQLKDPFVDETKIFAEAVNFAENPLANLDQRLAEHGIFKTIKQAKTTINIDGTQQTTEEEIEIPIHHEVRPLKAYAKEWMRKRHPVNRLRVNEFIRLAQAARGGDFLGTPSTTQNTDNSLSGRRLV